MGTHEEMMSKGFRPLTEVETDVRYYFTKAPGNNCQGVLLARHKRPGSEDEYFYEIKLTAPCATVTARGYDEESGEGYEIEDGSASVGDILRFDETAGVRDALMKALKEREPQEVYLECDRKVSSKNSKRSFWRIGVFARPYGKKSD